MRMSFMKRRPSQGWLLLAAAATAAVALVACWAYQVLAEQSAQPPELPRTSAWWIAVDKYVPEPAQAGPASPALAGATVAGPAASTPAHWLASGRWPPIWVERSPLYRVQAALSDSSPGLAEMAAMAIGHCMADSEIAAKMRTLLDAAPPANVATRVRLRLQELEAVLRQCQELDEFSLSQWMPLMRRALEVGPAGTAILLMSSVMLSSLEDTVSRTVAGHLRRDAHQCDVWSLRWLSNPERNYGRPITAEERLAYWHVLRAEAAADPAKGSQDAGLAWSKPPDAGDQVEMERLRSEITDQCAANRKSRQ